MATRQQPAAQEDPRPPGRSVHAQDLYGVRGYLLRPALRPATRAGLAPARSVDAAAAFPAARRDQSRCR